MDDKKRIIKGVTEEPAQPEAPQKPVKDNLICIFRERDLLRNQADRPLVESAPGIFGRIKRKIRSLFRCP